MGEKDQHKNIMKMDRVIIKLLLVLLVMNCRNTNSEKMIGVSNSQEVSIKAKVDSLTTVISSYTCVEIGESNRKLSVIFKDSISDYWHPIVLWQRSAFCLQFLNSKEKVNFDTIEIKCLLPKRVEGKEVVVGYLTINEYRKYLSLFNDDSIKIIFKEILKQEALDSINPYGFISDLNLTIDRLLFSEGKIKESNLFGIDAFQFIHNYCADPITRSMLDESFFQKLIERKESSNDTAYLFRYKILTDNIIHHCRLL